MHDYGQSQQIRHWCVGSKAKSKAEKQQEGIAEEARAVWTLDEEKVIADLLNCRYDLLISYIVQCNSRLVMIL